MEIEKVKQLILTKVDEKQVVVDADMSKYTTFRIGGTADLLVKPNTIEDICNVIDICKQAGCPYYILGNGSNLLVSDEGYRGVIIQLFSNFAHVKVDGNRITAKSGAILSVVSKAAANNNLTGFEFAFGIPGTVGGAVVMNAGAYGGEIKDVIVSCEVLDEDGNLHILKNEDLELGYRTSIIQKKNYIVLEATFEFKPGVKADIEATMSDLMQRRKDKQPLDKPSAGSTFKRPEGYFAGKLIMDAGLRGYTVGGAMVSEKHCGFVVNAGDATCKDVLQLISDVKRIVKEKFGVELEPEVKMLT